MIADALKYLASLSQGAMTPLKVETGNPAVLTFIVNGNELTIDKAIPPRLHAIHDLPTFVSVCNRFAVASPSVWVDGDSAMLVIDDQGHRADVVTMELMKTDVFGTIEALKGSASWFEQKALLRLLRIDLAGALPMAGLADKVKRVRFENMQITTGEKTRDRESMGREINSRVDTGAELPETVDLEAAVFRIGSKFTVRCSFDADPARGMFQLSPLPDEIERVTTMAVIEILERIRADVAAEVNVYHGAP